MRFTVAQLAELTGAQVVGDPTISIEGVADLASASPSDISFLGGTQFGGSFKSYEKAMRASKAGAIFVSADIELPSDRQFLVTSDPSQAFQQVVRLFHPPIPSGFEGIHPAATIHPTAKLADGVTVGPSAVIDRDTQIGKNTHIGAGVFVGAECQIGDGCLLHPNSTLREGCHLGNRVILQPGAVIGSCGFGYTTNEKGIHTKIDQLGRVVLEDDVEIGANTTIDRARFTETRIRAGTKIDNLVQIAHGVDVGPSNLIVGQSGIAGSTKTGRNVVLAGQVAINGHIELGDQVIVAARSAVMKSLKEPGKYIGEPAIPYADYRRHFMHLLRLGRYAERIQALEKKLADLNVDS
jgi:UDP-3-O-[3-hydroxymyristoyl] glucosamine N-acyltransferase